LREWIRLLREKQVAMNCILESGICEHTAEKKYSHAGAY
jgi:hypothetical protein